MASNPQPPTQAVNARRSSGSSSEIQPNTPGDLRREASRMGTGCFMAGRSRRRGALLPPDPQSLLGRPVGETEQHGFLLSLVRDRNPGRDHQYVVLAPGKPCAAHLAAPAALDAAIDGRVRRAVRPTAEPGGEPLNERPH